MNHAIYILMRLKRLRAAALLCVALAVEKYPGVI